MLVLALFPVASLADSVTNKLPTSGTSLQGATQSNGDLVVYVLKDNTWQEQGSLSFDRFESKKELKLTDLTYTEEVKIKIVQKEGGSAHLDSVLLGGEKPIKSTGEDISLKKLSSQDLDVITLEKSGIEITFPQGQKDRTLEICARIEAVIISQTPFLFPIQSGEWTINDNSSFYTYKLSSHNETPKINEILNTLSAEEPFFKEVCLPGSGHPPGNMYGWVKNDSENLYIAIDATSDNTMDGDKDYVKVYAKTAEGIKMFKLSVPETKWGKASFIYTDKVAYQHKVYEFVIPLSELSISDIGKAQDLSLAFEVYGTLSDPIYFEPDSYQVNEDSDEVLVRIIRPDGQRSGVGTAVITCQINDATSATLDEDFTIQGDGQIVFDEGVRERTVLIKLIDDDIEENVEKIALSIFLYSGEGTHIGSSYEAVITVNDNDGSSQVEKTIQFEQATYETPERDGVSVYLTRTGETDEAAAVEYRITDVEATAGEDYIFEQTDIIEFAAGEAEYHLWIPICNDSDVEPDETFIIRLTEADAGYHIGSPRETVITILNNDEYEPEEGTISFEKPRYSIRENQGSAEITVIYTPRDYEEQYFAVASDGPEEGEITVQYSTIDGTAKEGSDYTETFGTLTFSEEAYIQTFEVPIINDSKAEGSETVMLTLTNATGGAELGEQASTVLTITDDDKKSPSEPKKKSPPKEVPPTTTNLPEGTIIGRMPGYITLSEPTKIIDGSKEIQLSYNTEMSQNNVNNTPRVYYWNADKKNWVALVTYNLGDGKVKAINDNGYKGWFVVFGVMEPRFSDLEGSIFEQLLNRMNGLGIIEGIPIKGETQIRTARPDQSITRAEFTMLISRVLNIDVDDHKLPLLTEVEAMLFIYANYNDSNKIAEWVVNPVGTLVRADLIAGEGEEFRGAAPITRIEAAVMTSKALRLLKECKLADYSNIVDADKIPEWAKEQVAEGVITIYPDDTIRPNEDITRADAFEMLYKLFVIGLGW